MQINKHTLQVNKTAHYASYGELSDSTKYFWFVLHGSHMLCEQMIYKFEGFNPKEHFVIAPEGLSRFYLKGFSGDVVATWMTKQDRLTEIDDFSIYLSDLYEKYTNQIPKGCKRIIFGFSQGGTSAFRWMYKNKVSYDKILAYSSWIPEDLDFSKSQTPIHEKKIIYTIGKQDQFTSEEKRALLKEIIRRNGLHVDFEYYDGMHRVEKKQLKYIFKKHIMV